MSLEVPNVLEFNSVFMFFTLLIVFSFSPFIFVCLLFQLAELTTLFRLFSFLYILFSCQKQLSAFAFSTLTKKRTAKLTLMGWHQSGADNSY